MDLFLCLVFVSLFFFLPEEDEDAALPPFTLISLTPSLEPLSLTLRPMPPRPPEIGASLRIRVGVFSLPLLRIKDYIGERFAEYGRYKYRTGGACC